jgi:negative regulator of flagellin synthesis FlgM
MAGKITGFEQRPVQVANHGASERTAGKSAAAPGAATSDAAHVKLTGSAMQLAALEKALAQVPEVDLERVRQLRSEIEAGTYQVDSQRIASKLMQLERALATTAAPVAEQAPVDVPGQQV